MENKLTDRHRPVRFDQVVGQDVVVQWCETQFRKPKPRSSIFHGLTGCGKTTLARLYGRSLACLNVSRISASPCGTCSSCCADPRDWNSAFREIDCRRKGVAEINDILDSLRNPHFGGGRRVLHFSEAQLLSRSSCDSMLKILEDCPEKATFIFSLENLEKLPSSLVDRCERLPVASFSRDDLFSHASKICSEENISCGAMGLALLAELADGCMRDLIQSLDEVHQRYGDAREDHVRLCFDLEIDGELRLIRALFDGQLQAVIEASERIRRSPADTQKFLVRTLTGLRLEQLSIICADAVYRGISETVRQDFLRRGRQISAKLGFTDAQFWKDLTDFWSLPAIESQNDLRRRIVDGYEQWFEPSLLDSRSLDWQACGDEGNAEPKRRRPHIRPRGTTTKAFLNLDAAAHLWDSASFMAQEFGVYLNTRIILRHGRLGFTSERAAARFSSEMLRRLSDRFFNWTGQKLHWLYVHSRTEEGLSTILVMHLPADIALFAQDWLFENFLAEQFEQLPNSSVSFRSINFDDVKRAALYHRMLLRLLSHNIDPNIFIRQAGRRRLIDVISIPAKLRREFLPIDLEMHRVSKTIGPSAIKKFVECGLPPLTPARDGAWAYHNPPWEIWEHGDRKMTKQDIGVAGEASHSDIFGHFERELLKSAGNLGRTGVHHRLRSWPTLSSPGWWHGAS